LTFARPVQDLLVKVSEMETNAIEKLATAL
jgi:hypothetical protein